jgi:hypothetical protein
MTVPLSTIHFSPMNEATCHRRGARDMIFGKEMTKRG